MKVTKVRVVVVLASLAVFFLLGHFMAPELADESQEHPAAPVSVVSWANLQDFFDECLTPPKSWPGWVGEPGGGLLVVLRRMPIGDRFQVLECLEGPDLMAFKADSGLLAQIADWAEQGELVVTSCGTGDLDLATRQRFQAEFQARFMAGAEN